MIILFPSSFRQPSYSPRLTTSGDEAKLKHHFLKEAQQDYLSNQFIEFEDACYLNP